MKTYYFRVKKDIDVSKYGFVKEGKKEWVVWRNTRRLWFDTKTYLLRFNSITNEILSIFYKMISDGVIEYKEKGWKPTHYHYIGLTDSEYEMIKDLRAKNQWKD